MPPTSPGTVPYGLDRSRRRPMAGIRISGRVSPDDAHVLGDDALAFVASLEREFGGRRRELLARRAERRATLAAGGSLDFPAESSGMRAAAWRVAEAPADLRDRRVEITGPAE